MADDTHHVVMYSGGTGSWMAAKRVAEAHGTSRLTLLFSDTMIEDSDLYRFLIETAAEIYSTPVEPWLVDAARNLPQAHEDLDERKRQLMLLRILVAGVLPGLVWLQDGRDIWEVFKDENFLGNSNMDPCSKILKRKISDRWKQQNCDPCRTVCYTGIDWSEEHRHINLSHRMAQLGWLYKAPLCDAPYLTKKQINAALESIGIALPHLYVIGMSRNNCGGACVKAGQGHFKHLYEVAPERYAFWEKKEEEIRRHLGMDVSMLTDRRGDGKKKPLTLRTFRTERLEAHLQPVDKFDVGGCGCAIEYGEKEE